jgi:hypothetical protein
MERLIAHFTIILDVPLLVEDRRGAKRAFKVEYDAYEVEVAWDDKDVHSRVTKRNARRPCYGISKLKISVGRPLRTDQYPKDDEPKTNPGPRLDHADVAAIILNRLIRYFRFTLGNPLLGAVRAQDLRSSNSEWTIENPNPSTVYVEARDLGIVAQGFAGLRHAPAFGIKPFTPEQPHEFKRALQADTDYELYEELMVDARDALMQGNLRRAVIEMATACEVLTKELFAKKQRRGGSNIPVALHTGAKKAFGVSFKEDHPKDWHHIVYLFQCRDDAAHGSVPNYKDKDQNPQNMDFSSLRDWWESLETLIAWVRSQ